MPNAQIHPLSELRSGNEQRHVFAGWKRVRLVGIASVVSGGAACVLSVVAVAAWIPEIVRYRAHRDEVAAG